MNAARGRSARSAAHPETLPGELLWDDFFSRQAHTKGIGGTGLGLTIAKRLVEAMRGNIEVESDPNEGTKFSVTLAMPVSQQETSTILKAGLRGLRALIVDDNPTNRLILERYLSAAGMEHVSAAGAYEGPRGGTSWRAILERWLRSPSGNDAVGRDDEAGSKVASHPNRS